MRTLIMVPIWKRQHLTGVCLEQLSIIDHDIVAVGVYSPEDRSWAKPLLDSFGFDSVEVPNFPIGEKLNIGLKYSMKHNWDYYMGCGSDDLIHPDIFKTFETAFRKGWHYFGTSHLAIVKQDGREVRIYESNPNVTFGLCRMISREIVNEVRGHLWQSDKNTGLDGSSHRLIYAFSKYQNSYKQCRVDKPYCVDIKSDTNINPFKRFEALPKWKWPELVKDFPLLSKI